MLTFDNRRYESDTVISKLHRSVESLNMPANPDLVVALDIELVVPGFESFSDEAKRIYAEYVRDSIGIMRLFGIRTEV